MVFATELEAVEYLTTGNHWLYNLQKDKLKGISQRWRWFLRQKTKLHLTINPQLYENHSLTYEKGFCIEENIRYSVLPIQKSWACHSAAVDFGWISCRALRCGFHEPGRKGRSGRAWAEQSELLPGGKLRQPVTTARTGTHAPRTRSSSSSSSQAHDSADDKDTPTTRQ